MTEDVDEIFKTVRHNNEINTRNLRRLDVENAKLADRLAKLEHLLGLESPAFEIKLMSEFHDPYQKKMKKKPVNWTGPWIRPVGGVCEDLPPCPEEEEEFEWTKGLWYQFWPFHDEDDRE
jgi:hypothetical protein